MNLPAGLPDSEMEIGRRIRESFDLFFLGLVFSVFALAVQTSHLGKAIAPDAVEIAAWAFLLGAGAAGIFRYRELSSFYQLGHMKKRLLAHVCQQLIEGLPLLLQSTKKPRRAAIETDQFWKGASTLREKIEAQSRLSELRISRFTTLHTVLFLAGLGAVAFGRALPVVVGWFGHILR